MELPALVAPGREPPTDSPGPGVPTGHAPAPWAPDRSSRAVDANTRQHRLLDVSVALAGIVLTLPVMLAIAVAIALTSPGPVLYRQPRVGIDRRRRQRPCRREGRGHDAGGQLFTILKFRTMRGDSSGTQVWARPDDERVTSVGRVLRRTRLDELPQLLNVLRGEMSVVGPRPEQPELFARLRHEIDGYDRRQAVLPGITGWAQIHLAYDRCVDDARRKLDYDLAYIARRSPLQDLRIMLRTVPVMLGWPVRPSSGTAAPRDRARASRGASPVSADPRQA